MEEGLGISGAQSVSISIPGSCAGREGHRGFREQQRRLANPGLGSTFTWWPVTSWRTIPGQSSLEEQDLFRRSSDHPAELGGLVGPPRAPEEHSQLEKPREDSDERSSGPGEEQLQAPGAAMGTGQGSCPTSIVPSHTGL